MYKIGEVYFRLLGANGFHAKAKNERFTAVGWRCCQNLKNENFTPLFGRLRQKENCTKKRTARAPRLFFLVQEIKALIILHKLRSKYMRKHKVESRLLFHERLFNASRIKENKAVPPLGKKRVIHDVTP